MKYPDLGKVDNLFKITQLLYEGFSEKQPIGCVF